MKTTRHFLVSGSVQGVGYRRFAEKAARGLNLTGWVRNLNDGRVEAIATGTQEDLDKFHLELQQGPRLSQVKSVEWREVNEAPAVIDFAVVKDGEKPWVQK